jgi:nucleotide-binding universal stress UspA family protein
MFNTILVPTDGSKLSQKAVVVAMLLSKVTGAKLIALHVYSKFPGSPYGTYGPAEDVLAEAHVRQHGAEAGTIFVEIKNLADAVGVARDTALVEATTYTSRSSPSPRRENAIYLHAFAWSPRFGWRRARQRDAQGSDA